VAADFAVNGKGFPRQYPQKLSECKGTAIMEQKNLQPEIENKQEPCQLLVGLIGFKTEDEESFGRFFQVVRNGQRKYTAANPSGNTICSILMVNYDDPAALKAKDTLLALHPHVPVVAVSRGPLTDPPIYHIRGMLFAARVLTTLDKVSLEIPGATPGQLSVPALSAKLQHSETVTAQASIARSSFQPLVKETSAPRAEVSDTAPVRLASVTAAETPASASGYLALVVDDSVAIQKSLELNLATLPQISLIDFADSGESAIEKAEAKHYDLIFLDVMMPGIDGYETCTRLRKKPEYKKTPIIMVSGKTSPLDEVKGVMAGCTTYLTKPVQKEAFQKLSVRVLTWLDKQKNLNAT
jgi:two-component system, cell cycle response regulator